mgnify:FL=1
MVSNKAKYPGCDFGEIILVLYNIMMEVKNLIKKFQTGDTELIALKNLSFTVPTGQFLAITGRSGSGKSTLLYQMCLLYRSNEG